MNLELHIFSFISSVRQGNFKLYVDSLTKLTPWFFAMNHGNYARWLPVHIRDMASLENVHPDVFRQFSSGNFVVHKTDRPFSAIGIDHAHEQANALVKGDGGAIGITEDPSALRRWMLAGPEVARVIQEFEVLVGHDEDHESHHHEQTRGAQANFAKDVRSLSVVIEEMGNPFPEYSENILVLDTRNIVDPSVKDTVIQIESLGQQQYNSYVQDRLVERSTPIHDPIKRNKLALFKNPEPKVIPKAKLQASSLKTDCSLFSRLFISCQVRDGNLDDFFQYENQLYPPSISDFGSLHSGTQSDLLGCLRGNTSVRPTDIETIVIDGAALVHILQPDISKHKVFDDYAHNVFLPYVESLLRREDCKRVDLVWNIYLTSSLKVSTRSKRGKGTRRRVEPENTIPRNWKNCLRDERNKTKLLATWLVKWSEQIFLKARKLYQLKPETSFPTLCGL